MSQPARFVIRSSILRDTRLSHAAKILYLLLDDESKGADYVAMKQSDLSVMVGVKDRQVREISGELEEFGYLGIERSPGSNVYDFHRRKTTGRETGHRQKITGATGRKSPVATLLNKKTQEERNPPPPFLPVASEEEEEDLTAVAEAVAEHVAADSSDLREVVAAARRSKPEAPVEEIAQAVRLSVPHRHVVRHPRYFVTAVPRTISSQWFRNATAARAAPVPLSVGEWGPYEEPEAQRGRVA